MNIFSDSDKKKGNPGFLDGQDLGMIDISREFQTSLGIENSLFNRFSIEEVNAMMEEAGMFRILKARGYVEFEVSLDGISDMDNRIYIKDPSGGVLVHMRLKFSDFQFKKLDQSYKLVYIDWLLTQNLKMKNLKTKKKLHQGQEYPGLSVMNEITGFIRVLATKMGAYGAFNIPEYFHDAVLFHKSFQFVDPEKEGKFRAILQSFSRNNLRELSDHIHGEKIVNGETGEVYSWKYGEMVSCISSYLESALFDEEYYKKVKKIVSGTRYIRKF
ncbi:hypothetical protein EHQ12_14565 [Leptospira gomenensis]|uniref:Uncharacterized protein n=1 Tax=Leptospira gomenensis TaxID=2484974 RepID=A0A5F1Y8K6_9LEPT|nr:hypothetical protein [Leptospira gomenensis]TGK31714.1 hypothetical protein EHQ17_13090 [Leptospira gomenensis]TGK36093.1 hypothetical protein EHQ12_14565 [Leptospira gomenensis]TGK41657.1 hypothetical protein EHQ07_16380 [Leptospira gomenensis]TGK61383.1 hypothetical protein EHQ13_08485 [Leptospira gomenensis]